MQIVQEHISTKKCRKCSSGTGDFSLANIVQDKDRLQRLGAGLQVYSICKQALSQPQQLQAGHVPPQYVKLAKNCAAAIWQAANFCDKDGFRCDKAGESVARSTQCPYLFFDI